MSEAELLYNQSTSGVFLDPTQDPMEMVKQMKKVIFPRRRNEFLLMMNLSLYNCLDFMGLEKQLRQYAEWQILLAANSATTMNEDPIDIEEMENVSRWSTEIDLRKDLWKYLEITSSSIKQWKNTFINKVGIFFSSFDLMKTCFSFFS